MKPAVFIGSSTEGLDEAYAIQSNIWRSTAPTVWRQGVFMPGSNVLSDLMAEIKRSHFAIFVFTPDDIRMMRGNESRAVRDNVIFETGLFMGRLGKDRVFFVIPDDGEALELPSDLIGVTPGTYDASRRDRLEAALGPFCHQVLNRIKKQTKNESRKDTGRVSLGSMGGGKLPTSKSDVINDYQIHHYVKILNEKGDAIIRKTSSFVVNRGVIHEREHAIFCDTYPMADIHLEAWDERGNTLYTKITSNSPNGKKFTVVFRNPISANNKITYTFQYRWDGMFSKREDCFTIRNNAPQNLFTLAIPSNWKLKFINAKEHDNSGTGGIAIELKEISSSSLEEGFVQQEYSCEALMLHSEIEIRWCR